MTDRAVAETVEEFTFFTILYDACAQSQASRPCVVASSEPVSGFGPSLTQNKFGPHQSRHTSGSG